MKGQFASNGYLQLPSLLDADECADVLARLLPAAGAGTANGPGTRCQLAQPWCAELARRLRADARVASLLETGGDGSGSGSVAIQCNYFEKSAQQNWLVPLHQDLSIAVAARPADSDDTAALRGWTLKEGSQFVQPPASLLEQLVALRIHLDPCGLDDGPLRVVPGSHLMGILPAAQALAVRDAGNETSCCAGVGDGLLLRPLLLYASSRSCGSSRRRVLHFVFGPRQAPYGLQWQAWA